MYYDELIFSNLDTWIEKFESNRLEIKPLPGINELRVYFKNAVFITASNNSNFSVLWTVILLYRVYNIDKDSSRDKKALPLRKK